MATKKRNSKGSTGTSKSRGTSQHSASSGDRIDQTLSERGSRYGKFTGHAFIAQALKDVMRYSPSSNFRNLSPQMRESLDMIQHKVGRILNGDPLYKDSWTDIIGYTRLIEQELSDEQI